MSVDSLTDHSRRLRLRDVLETIRLRVLPIALSLLAGILIGLAWGGAI